MPHSEKLGKSCRNCGELLPLSQFYKHHRMIDGHLNICRDCVRRRVRKHRLENDHVREYDRERAKLPHRKKKHKQVQSRWYSEHPERKTAHTKVERALAMGALTKGNCHFCGADKNIEGHHNDYSKPLDVVWLCRRCHRKLHAIVPEPYKAAA